MSTPALPCPPSPSGHKGPVRAISVSPDGQYMVSGGDDGTVRLWELDTSLCRYVFCCMNTHRVAPSHYIAYLLSLVLIDAKALPLIILPPQLYVPKMTSSIGSQLISISLSAHTYCIICSSYKKHLLPPSPLSQSCVAAERGRG